MLTDEQTVEQLIEMQERARRAAAEAGASQRRAGPPLSSWTPEVEALHALVDAVRHLEMTVVAANNGNPGQWVPSDRPWTAYDEVQARRREREHEANVARLLPHRRRPSA